MTHPITSNGLKNSPISTSHQIGEGTQTWIDRHTAAIQASQPSGNKLTTSWASASGAQTATTDRAPGEGDESFLLRHMLDYLDAMVSEPPIP